MWCSPGCLGIISPRAVYKHEWGNNRADAKVVVATWYMRIADINSRPKLIPFDIIKEDPALINGLDIKRFTDTLNLGKKPSLIIKKRSGTTGRRFHTQLVENHSGNLWTWMQMAGHPSMSATSLMVGTEKRHTVNVIKKLHGFTYASKQDMINLLEHSWYKGTGFKIQ